MTARHCAAMLTQSVRVLWCRAFGHDWTEFGDVRRCRTCETVQHRVVGPGGSYNGLGGGLGVILLIANIRTAAAMWRQARTLLPTRRVTEPIST